MKKFILLMVSIFLVAIFGLASTSDGATRTYGRDALNGTTKACDNIACSGLVTGDLCFVTTSDGAHYLLQYDSTDTSVEGLPYIVEPDDVDAQCSGNGTWHLVSPREIKRLDIVATNETPVAITAANILANKYITNQGSSSEADWTMPDIEYYASVVFIVNEAFIEEICPPNSDAHEAFDLDGVVLDASDCIDSPIIVGSKIVATRMQIADGTWKWSFDTARGIWLDTGATDP